MVCFLQHGLQMIASCYPDYVPSVFSFNNCDDTCKFTASSLAYLNRVQQWFKHNSNNLIDNSQKSKQSRNETMLQPESDTACPTTSDIMANEENKK